jgi:gliding-associated putative ABC transporter substrate-binding component GldG
MKSQLFTTVSLVIGIIVVINLLGNEYHLRWDLTEDKQYTLSSATEEIVKNLDEPITIKAYFSKNLPPHIEKTRQDFQDILIEYASLSDGQVMYEFTNPGDNPTTEQDATQKGIRPVLINVREKDQVKQQKAFLGATIQRGEKSEVIPFVQPGAAMEYALSTAIKKISVEKKPKIGFIQGHGEPAQIEMPQAAEQLSVLYEPIEVTLTDSTTIPDDVRTIAIIRPTDSIPASHFHQLDKFLSRGGRLLVAFNRVQTEPRTFYGVPTSTGLARWLTQKGVDVAENFIVDAKCGSVTMPQQFGAFTLQTNVSFPYVPVISTFSDHPITSGLETVMFEFASEVKANGDSSVHFTPIAFSSELSNALPAPQMITLEKEWTEEDFPSKNIPIAAAVEKRTGTPYRMVVIGDGDFPVNGPPQQQQRNLQPDNVNLLSNAIDWLQDDTGLIELRTKGAVSRPILELDETTRIILKYGNFLLPIALALLYGIVRAHKNRIIRQKRMHENYETIE